LCHINSPLKYGVDMNTQILKGIHKQAIRNDRELAFKICMANKGKAGKAVSFRTLDKWLQDDSDKLTTATTLDVIRQHLGISESEKLTEAKEEVGAVLQN
jgi:hypothetical protein